MINITKVNPCRPFFNMVRPYDFEEILTDSLVRGFGLSLRGKLLVDEAIHHVFQNNQNEQGRDASGTNNAVIMYDIVKEIWELRNRFGEEMAFEICALFNPMIDDTYAEFNIFCDRDGIPINGLDIDQLKALYRYTSNQKVRAFIEHMITYSLMF